MLKCFFWLKNLKTLDQGTTVCWLEDFEKSLQKVSKLCKYCAKTKQTSLQTKPHFQSQERKIYWSKKWNINKNIYGCDKCIIFPSFSSSPVPSFKCCELKCKHLRGTRDIWRSDEKDGWKMFYRRKENFEHTFSGSMMNKFTTKTEKCLTMCTIKAFIKNYSESLALWKILNWVELFAFPLPGWHPFSTINQARTVFGEKALFVGLFSQEHFLRCRNLHENIN